ncbi:MAG: FtsX-like permease family protein [Candidatus Dadabacteria bacterium]|nr:MAG: FtsX-like permease family protein [Candidatus Dadabacteria bacterium]
MAIGVAAVVVLTALGEGARRYVVGEFASLGTNLVIVLPGRVETGGIGPVAFSGETPRDLTVGDALSLARLPGARRIAPIVVGSAPVSARGLERSAPVIGSTSELLAIRHWKLAQGRFLPPGDPQRAAAVCVLGAKVRRELFGPEPALGRWVRIGDRRFRVIGVLATEGRSIGVDVQDVVIVPVASAQALFNTNSLFRILVEARSRQEIEALEASILKMIKRRHQGEEDVTIVTQDAVLATFDRIFRTLTLAVAGIAAISLAVAGILIMNVMLVAVAQRRPEIGILKALGASRRRITRMFLLEASLVSAAGAAAGLIAGQAAVALLAQIYPRLPFEVPPWAAAAAAGLAVATGVLFAALPARRAARLDPVAALSGQR